jgi:hypothetical protein
MRRRRRIYLIMMASCALLYLVSWTVIAPFSATWAVVVSVMASTLPPIAVIIANRDDQA